MGLGTPYASPACLHALSDLRPPARCAAAAGSPNLVPLLLQPADTDVLASFAPGRAEERARAEKAAGKRKVGDGGGGGGGGSPQGRGKRRRGGAAGTSAAAAEAPESSANAGGGADASEETCWKALEVSHHKKS